MLINCLVSEIQGDIGRKSSIFSYPLAFDALVRGVPVGIAPCRLVRKNENGLATTLWKNFEDIFIHFGATHERDGQTDGHRVPAIAALCIASHGKNHFKTTPRCSDRPRQYAYVGFSRRNKIPRCSAYDIGESKSNPVPAFGL